MSMNAIGEQGAAPIGEPLARQFINILGISLHPMRFLAAADLLEQWVAERLPRIVCFPGSDMLAASQRNTKLGSALNSADLTATDGMMLVRLCRWFGATQAERVYGPDVMLELCRRSPGRGYRHFFYVESQVWLPRSQPGCRSSSLAFLLPAPFRRPFVL